ncbi:MAG: glycosyltransferase [Pyrinomonadaceae bacterium]|nr:glycosyltransferase [Pyrinomonadaceae bacterium]
MRHNDHLSYPEVSVITPLYNSSRYIEGTLDALCAQTFGGWESILVDDGSTDDTAEKIKRYLRDGRFTYIKQENGGIAAARNAGIRAARGEWICLLDHDDRWMPAKLEKQLAFADANNCDIVCTDAVVVQEHSRKLYSQFYSAEFIAKLKRINDDMSADAFELLIQNNFLCASSVMLRKTLFDKVGLFDPDAAPADDYDMWLRCMPDAKIGYLKEPLIEYHIHAGNFSHNFTNMVEKIIYVLRRSAEAHGNDGSRLKQLGDSLIPYYRLLLTELLEKRQYGSALHHTASLLARGRRGFRWFYWIADRDLLVTLCKSFAGKTDTRRSVFGEQNLDAAGRRNNVL